MQVEITIKNYRCFPDSKPARVVLRNGFTAFVGVNNSGKSSLLKFFYEFRNIFSILSSPSSLSGHVFEGGFQKFDFPSSVFDREEVFSKSNNRDLVVEVRPIEIPVEAPTDSLVIPAKMMLTISRDRSAWTASLHTSKGPIERGFGVFSGTVLHNSYSGKLELSKYFDAFRSMANALYVGPFRNATQLGSNLEYFDMRIGQDFVQTWRTMKTGNVGKQNETIYRLTEDIRRIFGYRDLEINPSETVVTLQVFIDGRSFRLPELGTGITQFILVLANVAIKNPSYVLIDEPELNLHPSLQLDFLTTLASYAREGILFGTHNIGLARASADWVYSLQKIQEGESEINELGSTPRLSEFVGELSFSGYREIGFNKVLLVEGRTDVKTVQQFLRYYRKDHQIVILPLGGSQLINDSSETELQEIKRISENVFALIDSERDAPDARLNSQRAAFVELCGNAKIACHPLERRAIENYLSDAAVKKIKGPKYQALGPYQKLNDTSPAWAKEENWRIAREMSIDDLTGTDLGKFLESI
jgi:energy-coupling factor transporter ATP-binding protein EcfA2